MYDWVWTKDRAWESQADNMRMRGDNSEGYALNTAKARLGRAGQAEGLVR